MKSPLVSVITVVYNGESTLEKTILSVLNQSYANIEYIIIDGGSTDNTQKIIKKYEDRIKNWISEADYGIYDAMNKGIRASTGDYIHFINAGDLFFNNTVLNDVFQQTSDNADFIYGDSINVAENSERYITAQKLNKVNLKKKMGVCHQAIFVRRSVAPYYNLNYKFNADYNWVIDIIYVNSLISICYVPIPIVRYLLGGFSEKYVLKNLSEYIIITKKRFGLFQVFKNVPIYTMVLLRYIKNKFFGYEF